jgi:hypothetical protein
VGDDIPVDSETLLMTDFINLKIKPTQSFRGAHRDRVCIYRAKCSYVYKYLNLYHVSKKEIAWVVSSAVSAEGDERAPIFGS